jgi:hypothetical protein
MVLTHPDPALPRSIDDPVGIAPAAGRGERQRLVGAAIPAIEPAVRFSSPVIREIEGAAIDRPGPAAVLMHPRSGVKGRGVDVPRITAAHRAADHHIAAALARAGLQPADVVAVEQGFGKAGGLGNDQC